MPYRCPQVVARAFVEGKLQDIDRIEADAQAADKAYATMRAYLNGTRDQTEMPQFFNIIHTFANDLAKAHKENTDMDAKVCARVHGLSNPGVPQQRPCSPPCHTVCALSLHTVKRCAHTLLIVFACRRPRRRRLQSAPRAAWARAAPPAAWRPPATPAPRRAC